MRPHASLPVVASGFDNAGLHVVFEGFNLLLQILHYPLLLLKLRLPVAAKLIHVVVVGCSVAGGSSISEGKIGAGFTELPLAT